MVDFASALSKTLKNEGSFCDRRSTTGEVVNQGITHWTLRALDLMPGVPPATPHDIPATDAEVEIVRTLQPSVVESIYKTQYWDKIHCGELRFQDLADKVFDVHVNTGHGAILLQRAYNSMNWPGGPVLIEDGIIGRKTLDAVNDVDGRMLLGSCSGPGCEGKGFRGEAEKYYRKIGGSDLNAWLERLER